MSFAKFVEKILIPDFSNKFFHIESKDFTLPVLKSPGFYLHIPFCNSLCPYCPYDRILYNKTLAYEYVEALKREIGMKASIIGNVKIPSLYIGGGTPTTIIEKLPDLIETFRNSFEFGGNIFIETNPYDITDENMCILKDIGVSMISIGVQSFHNKFLKLIGRNYDEKVARESIRIAKKYFDSINIDLMFALPGQKEEDFYSDLSEAVKTGVSQITAYPLFTFPYSSVGRFLKLKNVKLPDFFTRKRMFELMHDYLLQKEFYPVSVWGFKRKHSLEFSSVTRTEYIGFGVSAATKVKNAFYMNTFSVPHYIEKVSNGEFAEVVKMNYTNLMDDYYYLYWKLYETRVPVKEFLTRFSSGVGRKGYILLKLLFLTGMVRRGENQYILTKRGMFYIHLMQNHFSMNYISKVWSKMLLNEEPQEILL